MPVGVYAVGKQFEVQIQERSLKLAGVPLFHPHHRRYQNEHPKNQRHDQPMHAVQKELPRTSSPQCKADPHT